MNRAIKLAALALSTVLVVALLAVFLMPNDPRAGEAASLATELSNEKVKRLYAAWEARHDANDGDHNVVLGIGFAKGLSVENTRAQGQVTLDLIDGEVAVEIYGLDEAAAEVWLVDNAVGSAQPEPGDTMRYLGMLAENGYARTFEATLGAEAFADFEVDQVVITRNGYDPVDGPVLFGSPGFFQRLYTQVRTGRLAQAYQQAVPAPLLTSPAMADNRIVDADTVTDSFVRAGADLFINETFNGNGRTCATCHPATNSFTIDPDFIARLDDSDPLFIAEQRPLDLPPGLFEVPALMRKVGLILENLDGFSEHGVMRGVPHVLALGTSVTGPNIPFDNTANPPLGIFPPAERTGWDSAGAPGAGSLNDFATGAVIQHFPLTINRVDTVDFRLPTQDELDKMEAFQLALGRSADIDLATVVGTFDDAVAQEGLRLFNAVPNFPDGTGAGRCGICHQNAGANIDASFFGAFIPGVTSGNANFGTGVTDLPSQPADLIDPVNNVRDSGFGLVSHDPAAGLCLGGRPNTVGDFGFGTVTPAGGAFPPGLCEEDFNAPPLVEAADTAPFFHSNVVNTIEAAVSFYNNDAFNNSNGAQLLANAPVSVPGSRAINLETTEVSAIATMLRLINVRENVRSALDLAQAARSLGQSSAGRQLVVVAESEIVDAIEVLTCGELHPLSVDQFLESLGHCASARVSIFNFRGNLDLCVDDVEDGYNGTVNLVGISTEPRTRPDL